MEEGPGEVWQSEVFARAVAHCGITILVCPAPLIKLGYLSIYAPLVWN